MPFEKQTLAGAKAQGEAVESQDPAVNPWTGNTQQAEAQERFDKGGLLYHAPSVEKGFSDFDRVDYMTNDQWESYQGHNIDFSPYMNMDLQRAQNQSEWAQFGGFLNQAILGEVAGGTIEGIGYLADMMFSADNGSPEYWLGDEEGNWMTEMGQGLREWTQEATPIHQEETGTFNPSDPAWWFSGGVSVASFASLAIPAAGWVRGIGMVGKGASALGKLGRLGKLGKASKAVAGISKVAKGAQSAAKTMTGLARLEAKAAQGAKWASTMNKMIKAAPAAVGQAYVSRHIESTLEGGQVFKELHEQYLEQGFDDTQARKLAAVGAAHTVEQDKALLWMDIAQYMITGTGFSPLKSGLGKLATKSDKALIKGIAKVGQASASKITNFAMEGGEEGYQFAAAEEGKLLADMLAGRQLSEVDRSMTDRIKDTYIKDGEMQTSMFFGGLGGVMFDTLQPVLDKATQRGMANGARLLSAGYNFKDIQDSFTRSTAYGNKIKKADLAANDQLSRNMRLQESAVEFGHALKMGRLAQKIDGYRAQLQMTPEQIEEHNAANPNDPIGDDFGVVPDMIAMAEQMQSDFDTANAQYGPAVAAEIATGEAIKRQLANKVTAYQNHSDEMENALPLMNKLSPEGKGIWNTRMEKKVAEATIEALTKQVGKKELTKATEDIIKKTITEYTNELPSLQEAIDTAEAVERDSKTQRKDRAALGEKNIQGIVNSRVDANVATARLDVTEASLNELRNPQTAEEFTKSDLENDINNMNKEELNNFERSMDMAGELDEDVETLIKARKKELRKTANAKSEKNRESVNQEDLDKGQSDVEMGRNPIQESNVNVDPTKVADPVSAIEGTKDIQTDDATVAAVNAMENAKRASEAPQQPDAEDQPIQQPKAKPTNTKVTTPTKSKGEVEAPKYGTTKMTWKKSLYSLSWKSIRNGGKPDQRVKILSDWLETPNAEKVGTKIEFVIDKDYIGEEIGIRANILDGEGNIINIDGQDLYAHIHEPVFQKANPNFKGHREQFESFRKEILLNLNAGNQVFSEITGMNDGHFLKFDNKGKKEGEKQLIKLNDLAVKPDFNWKFYIANKTGLMEGIGQDGKPKQVEGDLRRTAGRKSFTYLNIQGPDGRNWAAALDIRKINAKESDTLANLFKDLVEGAGIKDEVKGTGGITGLTYMEAIEMMVMKGSGNRGKDYYLDYSPKTRTVSYGKGPIVFNVDSIKKGEFDDFRAHLQNAMIFNTRMDLINQNFDKDFTFMGKEFKKGSPYNEFIKQNDALLAAFEARDGKFFIQPTIDFKTNLDIQEGTAVQEQRAEDVAQVEITNDEASIPLAEEIAKEGVIRPKRRGRTRYGAKHSLTSQTAGTTLGNAVQGREWIRKVLGEQPVSIVNGLLKVNEQGDMANGAFSNGMVILSNMMSRGTEFHEAFHAVFNLYLNAEERMPILAEAEAKYGKPTKADLKEAGVTNREDWLEEKLAEDFKLYMMTNGKVKFNKETTGFFNKLWKMIKNIFSQQDKVNLLYDNIQKGYFKESKVDRRIAALSNKVMYERVPGFTIGQTKAIAESLVADIVELADVFNTEDLSAITNEHVSKDYLKKVINGWSEFIAEDLAAGAMSEEEAQGFLNTYDQAKKNIDVVQKKVLDKFKSFNMELAINEEELEIARSTDGGPLVNLKSAFEFSGKDNANGNVKMLLASLPKMDSNGDNLADPLTGQPMLTPVSATWGALEKTLSGIVTTYNHEAGSLNTGWIQMMEKLDELAIIRPEIGILKDKLTDPAYPEEKRNQFFNAFSNADMNFQTPTVTGTSGNREFRVSRSNKYTAADQVAYEWADIFSDMMLRYNEATGQIVADDIRINGLQEFYNVALARARKLAGATRGQPLNEEQKSLLTAMQKDFAFELTQQGMSLSVGTMDYFSNFNINGKPRAGRNEADRFLEAVFSLVQPFTTGLEQVKSGQLDLNSWVSNEKDIRELAAAEALKRDDISEAVVPGAGTSTYYQYSKNNYLFKHATELQTNPELVDRLLAVPYNTNSAFLKAIKKGKKFTMEVFNNFGGKKYQELTPADELALRVNQTLKGHFSMLTAADKSVWYLMKGFAVAKGNVFFDDEAKKYHIGDKNVVNAFGKYFVDELARMKTAHSQVFGDHAVPMEERIQHYTKGNMNAFKSALFPSMSPAQEDLIGPQTPEMSAGTRALGIYMESNNNEPTWNTKVLEVIGDHVREALEARIEEDWQQAIDLGLVSFNEENEFTNNSLDRATLDTYLDDALTFEQSARQMLADYTLNQIRANVESTKLFTGDPAFYKNMDDFQKRVPGTIAPGQDLNVTEMSQLTFDVAVLNDFERPISDQFFEQYQKALVKDGMSEAAAKKLLDPYNEINVADAQGYITLERYRDLLKMLGQWRENKMADPFQRLIAGGTLQEGDYAVMLQPLKGMYFALDSMRDAGLAVPTYLKYSMAPLIPSMLGDSQIAQMAKDMKEQGISEVVFNSGIKVGAQGQIDMSTEGGFEFNPITLDNRHWKLQQEMGAKYMKKGEVIEPSQLIKNVLANINMEADYNGVEGKALVQDFIDTDRALSDIGLKDFEREFGIKFNDELEIVDGLTNNLADKHPKLYDTLKAELAGRNAPQQVIDMLTDGVPLDAIPQFRKKIQQTILSILNSRTVKLQMPGGAFVQQAPAMFEQRGGLENTDIIWLNDGRTLLPPRKGEGGAVLPGQVLLPSRALSKYKEKFPGRSVQEIATILQKEGLLEGVGARIPNQDLASSDYVEVVGILPDYVGDTVVTYPEVTAKTGSDYDIDKMFIMLPNFTISKSGIVTKVEYMDKEATLAERYRNFYKGEALANYAGGIFDNLTTQSQNNDIVKERINNLKADRKVLLADYDGNATAMRESQEYKDLVTEIEELYTVYTNQSFNDYIDEALGLLQNAGKIPTPVEFGATTMYQQNTKAAIQNHKLDLYKALLLSDNSFGRLISPIDSAWMKNQAGRVMEQRGNDSTTTSDLAFFGSKQQFDTKQTFAGGQLGIALTANQLVDHAMTQLADIRLNKYLGKGKKVDGVSSFALERGDNGEYITSNLSAYLNAFVDIAKDPYIFNLNINTVTSNTAFMLVRAGFDPEWVNAFMSQPILVDYVAAELNNNSVTGKAKMHPKDSKKAGSVMNSAELALAKYPMAEGVKPAPITMESLPSKQELEGGITTPDPAVQQAILKLYEEYNEIGEAFSAQVLAFKFDTNGAGNTLVDSIIAKNKMMNAVNDQKFTNVSNRMVNSMADTYYRNSTEKSLELMPQLFIGASDGFKGVMQSISRRLHGTSITRPTLATAIENQAYSYIMNKFPAFYVKNPLVMLTGKGSMGRQVQHAKHHPSSSIKDNPFIKALRLQEEEVTIGGQTDFFKFVRLIAKDTDRKNELTEAWEQLIYSPNENVSKLGKSLVKYAAYTSGMNQGSGTFFDLIPGSYLQSIGMAEFFQGTPDKQGQMELLAGVASGSSYLADFEDQFFRNNSNDPAIVPELKDGEALKYEKYPMNEAFMLAGNNMRRKAGKMGEFKPFVKKGNLLYKLTGYTNKNQPVYARSQTLGFQSEFNNSFKEYGVQDSKFSGVRPATDVFTPRAQPVKKQIESNMGSELLDDMSVKLATLQKHFPSHVKFDRGLNEIANVKQVKGLPVVTINPDKIQKDTVIHEYGHIYFSALGGFNNPFLQQGIDQLQGTRVWGEVAKNYPNLSGQELQEEVLITAVGREGTRLFDNAQSRSKWQNWLSEFWMAVKKMFGIKPSVAQQLAREMLSDQIAREYTMDNVMDGTRYQVEEGSREEFLEHEAEAIEQMVLRMRQAIEVRLQRAGQYMGDLSGDPQTEKRKNAVIADLKNFSEELAEMEGIEAIVTFIDRANRDTGRANAYLHKSLNEGTMNVDKLANINSYIQTYDIISGIEELVRDTQFPDTERGEEEKAALLSDIERIRRNKEAIKYTYNRVRNQVLAEEVVDETFLVRTKKMHQLQADYRKLHPRPKKKEMGTWTAARDEWVNERMAEKAEEYRAEELAELKATLAISKYDISSMEKLMMDPRAISDQLVQLGTRMVDRADFETMTEFMDTFRSSMDKYRSLGSSSIFLAENQVKKNAPFIENNRIRPLENTEGLDKEQVEYLKMLHELFKKADDSLAEPYKLATLNKDGNIVYDLPAIRKSTMEKFREQGVKDVVKEWWKDKTQLQADDTDRGQLTQDEEGKVITATEKELQEKFKEGFTTVFANEAGGVSKSVPVYFRTKLEKEDQSHDLLGIAMSNLYMAENFKNKIGIAPRMQLLQEAINTRETYARTGGGLLQLIRSPQMKKLASVVTKEKGQSNAADAFNSMVDNRMYGISVKDAGKILGVDVNKTLQSFGGYAGDLMLIGNYSSAIANLLQGHIATFIESRAGHYFNGKDFTKAVGEYRKDFGNIIQDISKTEYEKSSKVNILLQNFDVMGDFGGLTNSMLQDNFFKQHINKHGLHSMSGMAEHNIQSLLMISVMNHIKAMDANGNYLTEKGTTKNMKDGLSMWDVYSVKDGKLEIDPRVKTNSRNRTRTEWNQDQEFELAHLIKFLNADLNGNYDSKNKAMIQTYAMGNMAMMLRKWIPRGAKARFGGLTKAKGKLMVDRTTDEYTRSGYNEYTKSISEGRYTTFINFLSTMIREGNVKKFDYASKGKEAMERMTDEERANMSKNTTEFLLMGGLALAASAAAAMAEADGDDDDQWKWFLAYMTKRTQMEMSFFINPAEIIKTIDTPAVALKTIGDMVDTLGYLLPWNITDRYKSGENEGQLKLLVAGKKLLALQRVLSQFDKDYEKSWRFQNEGGRL